MFFIHFFVYIYLFPIFYLIINFLWLHILSTINKIQYSQRIAENYIVKILRI